MSRSVIFSSLLACRELAITAAPAAPAALQRMHWTAPHPLRCHADLIHSHSHWPLTRPLQRTTVLCHSPKCPTLPAPNLTCTTSSPKSSLPLPSRPGPGRRVCTTSSPVTSSGDSTCTRGWWPATGGSQPVPRPPSAGRRSCLPGTPCSRGHHRLRQWEPYRGRNRWYWSGAVVRGERLPHLRTRPGVAQSRRPPPQRRDTAALQQRGTKRGG